jgi:hypothetical protein
MKLAATAAVIIARHLQCCVSCVLAEHEMAAHFVLDSFAIADK